MITRIALVVLVLLAVASNAESGGATTQRRVTFFATSSSGHRVRLGRPIPYTRQATRSPDGTLVAYVDPSRSNRGFLRRLAGGPVRALAPSGYGIDGLPRFSSDGRKITFTGYDNSCGQAHCAHDAVYVENLDGSHLRKIGSGEDASFSPDGRLLAYAGDLDFDNTPSSIIVDRLQTNEHRRISNGSRYAWSPDGRRLLVLSDRRPGRCVFLCTVGADGTGLRNVPGSPAIQNATWTRKGATIAAAVELPPVLGDGNALSLFDTQTRVSRTIARCACLLMPVSSSPTGTHIAYLRATHGLRSTVTLWAVSIAGLRTNREVVNAGAGGSILDVRWDAGGLSFALAS